MSDDIRTQYFSNCLAVFEGGGVRTAAFAGAYAAAVKAGIGFSDVAGTSGGSIAAALVATGAPPDVIWKHVKSLDFEKLTTGGPDQAQKLTVQPGAIKRGLAWMVSSEYRKIAPIVTYGGLYDSKAVGDWVEQVLSELLGRNDNSRPVCFDDLPIPLHVVATDLSRREAKVWSKRKTPDDSVALAVRCSCAIPFFFQPVYSGGTTYVDGGVLSNMPSFVFANGQTSRSNRRVLTFRLQEAPNGNKGAESAQALATAIVNTVVDGASKIQQELQPNQFFVDINTADISSTDFGLDDKKKQFLHDEGINATRKFVRNEREELGKVQPAERYFGRDEKYLLYVQTLSSCNSELVILDQTCDWLYWLFPALLDATQRGVVVHCLTLSSDDIDEHQRRRLLKSIGVNFQEISRLPYRGIVCDPSSTTASVAVTTGQSHQTEDTRLYTTGADGAVVGLLIAALQLTRFSPRQPRSLPTRTCSDVELFDLLRTVPQYQHAKFDLEKVKFDESLHGTQTFVKEFKYVQIDAMCKGNTVPMLEPTWIDLNGSNISSLIIPPVVEQSGDRFVIVEGHVRALLCQRRGMDTFNAVVVRQVREPLPVEPRPFSKITLESKTVPKSEQFPGHIDSRWRYIERDVRNTLWTRLASQGS